MLSKNYLTLPTYLLKTILLLRNWPIFIYNHMLRKNVKTDYYFRNGLIIHDGAGTLPGTIAVVFIRKEYGCIKNYRTIVDIGANMGAFSIYAAIQNPIARIFSYEPESHNFSVLKANLTRNQLNNRVFAFKSAVASKNEQRNIFKNKSPINSLVIASNINEVENVNCVMISDIISDNKLKSIDLLKLNCEGAEYEILYNCDAKILSVVESLRLEYHNIDNQMNNGLKLKGFLENSGYKIERYTEYRKTSGFIWAKR